MTPERARAILAEDCPLHEEHVCRLFDADGMVLPEEACRHCEAHAQALEALGEMATRWTQEEKDSEG